MFSANTRVLPLSMLFMQKTPLYTPSSPAHPITVCVRIKPSVHAVGGKAAAVRRFGF